MPGARRGTPRRARAKTSRTPAPDAGEQLRRVAQVPVFGTWVLRFSPRHPCFRIAANCLPLTDYGSLIAGSSSFLTSRHHDAPAPPRPRPAANHDIHVAV